MTVLHSHSPDDVNRQLRELFDAAVAAADPQKCLAPHLPEPPKGRTVVIGAGKAAASMARALEANWAGDISGLVVTRYGHGVPCQRIEVVEAAHPVPDAKGVAAAERILEIVKGLQPNDLVVCLISGGGSALLSLPGGFGGEEGNEKGGLRISLDDKQAINRALLKSGANITEMNTVRKHLSAIKGGRLGIAAYPAHMVTLMISDVPGDDPGVIASGPTVGDPTSTADARAVLAKYAIDLPANVEEFLATSLAETPDLDDPRLANISNVMIATPMRSLEAAAEICRSQGWEPVILGDDLEGEARELALEHAALAQRVASALSKADRPVVLISGGETTVTVRGRGARGTQRRISACYDFGARRTPEGLWHRLRYRWD